MKKKLLFLLRQPPYGSAHALEAVESALVAGVFDQTVSVLFRDAGVWQLLGGQDAQVLGRRTLAKVLCALPEYEVSDLYVCADSITRCGLSVSDLVLPVTVLDRAQQHALLAEQDAVVND